MEERSAEELSQLEAALPSVVGFIDTIASSEIASKEGVLDFDGQAFFDTTVSKCVGYLDAIGQLVGEETKLSDFAATDVSIVEADEQQATLLVAVPGDQPQEQVFTRVEGRWVPSDIASEWTETIAETRASIEAQTDEELEGQKMQAMGVLTMIDGTLTQIESAETQEQFDQSLKGAVMPFVGMMMMFDQQGTEE